MISDDVNLGDVGDMRMMLTMARFMSASDQVTKGTPRQTRNMMMSILVVMMMMLMTMARLMSASDQGQEETRHISSHICCNAAE